jgi:proteic killer suppression protein
LTSRSIDAQPPPRTWEAARRRCLTRYGDTAIHPTTGWDADFISVACKRVGELDGPGGDVRKAITPSIWPTDVYTGAVYMVRVQDSLGELETFPLGNTLEALKRDRLGQHAIRINEQYRACFVWTGDGARNVEITEYH